MNKTLRFFFASMLLMLCGNMMAGEVTFDATADKGPAGTSGGTLEKSGITLTLTGGTLADYAEYRVYKNQTLTISSTVGNITKIEMACTAEGTAKWGPGSFGTGAPEGYTFEGKNGVWEGDAAEVAFTATDNQVRIATLTVTYSGGESATTRAAKPVFSPKGGTYEETVTVTLSHSNPEAEIWYTLDGDMNNAKQYTAPFTLTETTTVKAYAFDEDCDETWSEIVEETYTIVAAPEVHEVSVADFLAAEVSDTEWYQLTGVVKNLKDGDKFGNFDLEDETGSVYVFGVLSEKGGQKQQFQDLVAQYGIQNGSKLTIIGNRGYYAKDEKIEVMNAYFVSVDNSGVEPGPGPEPVVFEGEGTLENPYTIADVKQMTEAITEHVWVKGFIVGSLKSATAFADEASATNLALAATADETEAANCLPVQLPAGNIRELLNVADNPGNVGKEVKVCGTIEKYFQVMGVKNVDQYEMDGVVVGISELKADSAQQQTIYNLAGQRVQQAVKGLYIVNGKKVMK